MGEPIVIALDGTSASGKSTNAKLVAKALGSPTLRLAIAKHVDIPTGGAQHRTWVTSTESELQ